MNRQSPLSILLIEDSPEDTLMIQRMLKEARGHAFHLASAALLSEGLARLAKGGINLILLDLSLPDSEGLETLEAVQSEAARGETTMNAPMIVMTGLDDEETAIQAVRKGAQDYLVKGQLTAPLLGRAILYAVERNRLRLPGPPDARRPSSRFNFWRKASKREMNPVSL